MQTPIVDFYCPIFIVDNASKHFRKVWTQRWKYAKHTLNLYINRLASWITCICILQFFLHLLKSLFMQRCMVCLDLCIYFSPNHARIAQMCKGDWLLRSAHRGAYGGDTRIHSKNSTHSTSKSWSNKTTYVNNMSIVLKQTTWFICVSTIMELDCLSWDDQRRTYNDHFLFLDEVEVIVMLWQFQVSALL